MSEETLRAFFTDYGAALITGDVAAIAASYTLPALVLSDAGSIPLGSADQVAAAAHAAADDYRSQAITAILPRLTRLEPISATLTGVDVTWLYRDRHNKTLFSEAYRYLVRIDIAGNPLIQVAISLPVM